LYARSSCEFQIGAQTVMGGFDWLSGKQAAAQRRWDKALHQAQLLGMRYETIRTYAMMGRLMQRADMLEQAQTLRVQAASSAV
jgi:hypothetical protein